MSFSPPHHRFTLFPPVFLLLCIGSSFGFTICLSFGHAGGFESGLGRGWHHHGSVWGFIPVRVWFIQTVWVCCWFGLWGSEFEVGVLASSVFGCWCGDVSPLAMLFFVGWFCGATAELPIVVVVLLWWSRWVIVWWVLGRVVVVEGRCRCVVNAVC
jgi:hypothetical protein